ncbi:hypothetical protein ACKWTF_001046 [Chironomus riparius]
MITLKNYLLLSTFLLTISVKSESLVGSECRFRTNHQGICKDYKNCKDLIDKLRSHQIEFKDVVFCDSYGLVCCPLIDNNNPELSPPQEIAFKRRISDEKCKEYAESTKQVSYLASPILGAFQSCHRQMQPQICGTEAKPHEFPHQAVLGQGKEDSIDWVCGGSLISPQFVLTAAHCVPYANFVKIGINSLSQSSDQKLYKVVQKIVHPDYDKTITNNDIALLRLNQNVEFNEYVHPICLPTKQYDEPKAIVSGFGKTSFYDPISDKLLKVTVDKFSNFKCKELYDERPIYEKTMLCYGHYNETKDSCEGDSGGPLQVSNQHQVSCTYMQIGIVSFGPRLCGSKGVPGVYVNVFNYIDWIENVVWKDGI